MKSEQDQIDINALPVHLFVKSAKEAKKIGRQNEQVQLVPIIFKKVKRFRSAGQNYSL